MASLWLVILCFRLSIRRQALAARLSRCHLRCRRHVLPLKPIILRRWHWHCCRSAIRAAALSPCSRLLLRQQGKALVHFTEQLAGRRRGLLPLARVQQGGQAHSQASARPLLACRALRSCRGSAGCNVWQL